MIVGPGTDLSLYYFNIVCPRAQDGTRSPGSEYRHIPDPSKRHRHLLRGPTEAYRFHKQGIEHLLFGPIHKESSMFHEIAARADLFLNRSVVNASRILYFDEEPKVIKRRAAAVQRAPGSLRRFIDVLQQLDLTYDLHTLTAEQIIALLPPEFDEWRG